MEEVDIDNVEDLIELEARLYAQIHHDSTTDALCDEKNLTVESNTKGHLQPLIEKTTVRTVTATSVVNKPLGNKDGRYWSDVSRKEMAKPDVYKKSQTTAKEKKFESPKSGEKESEKVSVPKDTSMQEDVFCKESDVSFNLPKSNSTIELNSMPNPTSNSNSTIELNSTPNPTSNSAIQNLAAPENAETIQTSNTQSQTDLLRHSPIQKYSQNKPPKQKKKEKQQQNVNYESNKDIRVNPAAKKKRNDRRMTVPIPPNISKDGPFAKQVRKLSKAIRIEVKKQKSKEVIAKKKQEKPMETIILDTTDSEDDVIVVPIPPPPTFSICDSDEDKSSSIALEIEPINSFAKPKKQQQQQSQQHQQQQNSSRCTSPCSVLSSDDFIGQTDRCRLLQDSGMADDEDLLLLTADVDSLMELPKSNETEKTLVSESNERLDQVSFSDVVCTEFITPHVSSNNYRVEQTQFRALDVYESESDITDNVYSKGKTRPKETVIRTVGSSSSSDEDDNGIVNGVIVREKIKRLRKRRASGSNRESDANNEIEQSSDSDTDEVVDATVVPFIARGPAVEHCKTKCRLDSSSSRRASASGASVGQMSDSEFIATLNNLAQGAEKGEEKDGKDNERSDSDNEAPTARAIAEQVLAAKTIRQHYTSAGIVTERSASESEPVVPTPTAVPDNLLSDLDKVFETIDKLDKGPSILVEVSDDSSMDTDLEVAAELAKSKKQPQVLPQLIPQQIPEPIPQPQIEIRPKNALSIEGKSNQKKKKMSDDPVYNIVYSEENEFAGGLGWNDEMRRFYNDSWKGENINLRNIWSQMDANKNLWKIYTEDRFPKARRFMNLKCHNCCEFGHTRAKCTRPKKPLICYICGERGHYEPRCPNTICLRCGNKTQVFTKSCNACSFQNRLICPVCKVRGHTLNLCPDKWRRYHSTTQPNAYPNSRVEYNNRKYCSVCAGRGHLSETCKSAVRFLEYPIFVSEIKSHQKSYSDHAVKSLETSIGYNLLYKPEEDVSFELAENTTGKDYYGRFLKAVGMGYMLKRKRKATVMTSDESTSTKVSKINHEQYVPNPYLKAGQQCRTETREPEQVQEISESGNVDKETEVEIVDITGNNDIEEDKVLETVAQSEEPQTSTFKSPTVVATNNQLETSKDSEPIVMDSDSNYSFSEHFELFPLSHASNVRKPREMGPLPDFIPLNDNASHGDDNDEDDCSDVDLQAGISKKYITAETDEDADSIPKSPLPDLPCEAKIYLTHFHSKYLLSPEGHKFLLQKSKETDLTARLDWTSVGHVLIIFGLQCNQDKFHRELLLKYRQLSDQMNQKNVANSQKVPRRIDVLIRFLRENINLLMTNLGNVNELLKRMQYLENIKQSKNELKIFEKTRRSLNMILLGQAGLRDGNHHLDKLLLSLRKLINDFQGEELTPIELRNEIDDHWKMIFTPYRHDNYPELVQHYNKMLNKNRIAKLNIDPILLGGRMIDTQFTKEQKALMENFENEKNSTVMKDKGQQQSPVKDKRGKQLDEAQNPLNPKMTKSTQRKRNSSPPPLPPSMKIVKIESPDSIAIPASSVKPTSNPVDNFIPPTNSLKLNKNSNVSTTQLKKSNNKPNPAQPPFANPQQKSIATPSLKKITQNWESACDNLLKEIDDSSVNKSPARDCKAPSMFWSRESIKFVDECINKITGTNNTALMEKLTRVQEKSKNGQLSYNDYRAVIKIHNAVLGK